MKKSKIEIFSPRKEDLNKLGHLRENLGKSIVSKSGLLIGKVVDIIFDNNGIKGIIGRRGMSKFYVDGSYFSSSSSKIMLSIEPVSLLIGKEVFDADGKNLGKVVKVIRKDNKNTFKSIIVKKKVYHRKKEIPAGDIDVSKKNIILNKVYD